ncbi:hypothetical protein [Pigmentiphaga sp.]|uniref:hypothetical protein n=1 Tax=Pigmentiphaga sp. TaxID=1977564 RepID=UPI00128ADE90|nr:hypothetical protein [Pigmentiphaga sp.]MPS26683.1 hypothetical protein [Alcaligenaceae bacterium SAGV5]MPS53709.1 hypothetical protein [Alcaligenaceae bacterium SAGV3]MPT59220.1 hypothetical protein [Alcaligenaceae bacterium]
MNCDDSLQDTEFDLRARAELALAFEPGDPPPHLLRHTPWHARRGLRGMLAALLIGGSAVGAVLTMRPPELVRSAIEHEYYERTLRGSFLPATEMARHLDLPAQQALPGFIQLMRPCDIGRERAYHLTTFFEKGGIVTVLSFEQFQQIPDGEGWWANTYWKVVRSHEGRPLILIAQKKQALSVASRALGQPEAAPAS